MPLVIKTTRTGKEAAGKKEQRDALRATLKAIGEYHHDHIKGRHFKQSAARKYNHAKRQRSYIFAKIGKKVIDGVRASGSGIDLIFSGDTKRSVMASSGVKPKASNYRSGHVKVTMIAPNLNYRGWSDINMREELERTIPIEEKEVFDACKPVYFKHLANTRKKKTTTTKG